MFKLIGSIIIMLSSVLFGMKKYNEYHERKHFLCVIFDGAVSVQNNLRCMCLPLYECFLQGGEFFEKVALLIKDGLLPQDAVTTLSRSFHMLKDSDLCLIERFSAGLSSEDVKGQLANTEFFIKELEKQISDADTELNSKGKLFLKGSILLAAALVLLLI